MQTPQETTSPQKHKKRDKVITQSSRRQYDRRRLNVWIKSDIEDYPINQIYKGCFPLAGSKNHKETFRIIIDNLLVSPQSPVGLLLDKGGYRLMKEKPPEFTPSNISQICSVLQSKGYITLTKGYRLNSSFKRGYLWDFSTIQATDSLLDSIPSGLNFEIQRPGLIVTKEFTPPDVYPDEVQEAESLLLEYNQTVEPGNMLYAVYKGGFNVDGRFHGSDVIVMPKQQRKSLKIDGEDTTEIDVSNCIPFLLYAKEKGKTCPQDTYDITPIQIPRGLAKVAMLIMLNCSSRKTARQALQSIINFEYCGDYKANEILTALEDKHREVQEFLYTGIGRELMNIESGCMRKFMKEMLKEGHKVYPIYDSAVGKASDIDTIKDAFTEAFTINGVYPNVHFS